jgi:nitroreductase
MEFTEVIMSRRSIRKYRPDPVPEEKLRRLQEALRAAPTGSNRQPFKFIFVANEELRTQVAAASPTQECLKQAPVLMVATCQKGRSFDTAIAVDHMILTATNEGLGTCWIGWFDRGVVAKALGIGEEYEIPIMVPIGYAAEAPGPRPRKPLEELIEVR